MKVISTLVVVLCAVCFAGQVSLEVQAGLAELGGGNWEYSFFFTNTGEEAVSEVTIFLDEAISSPVITTSEPLGWDEILIYSDPFLGTGIAYDILNTASPIVAGDGMSGFSVAFYYEQGALALGGPVFDVIDTETSATLYSGTVSIIPEPISIALLGFGGLLLRRHN